MISMEDLEPLMGKPSSELMSSHVHKLIQVCVLLMRTFSFPFLFFFFIFFLFFLFVTYLSLQVLGESLYIS